MERDGTSSSEACVFCGALAAAVDPERLVLGRVGSAFLMLNAFPYTNGHVMVLPVRHVASLEELSEAEQLDLMRGVQRALVSLRAAYRPDGFNLGANLGSAAGAGVPGHVHLHVVPRWAGDTNFMAAVGGSRVLPEALADSYRRLRPHLEAAR